MTIARIGLGFVLSLTLAAAVWADEAEPAPDEAAAEPAEQNENLPEWLAAAREQGRVTEDTVEMDNLAQYKDAELLALTEDLWLPTRALTMPDGEVQSQSDRSKMANQILRELLTRHPKETEYYGRMGRNLWEIGELMPRETDADKERLIAFYDEMIATMNKCLELNPKEGLCLFYRATAIARQATTKGIIASLGTLEDIEADFRAVYDLNDPFVAPNGDPLTTDSRQALGEFYRQVPDSFFIKMIAGVRGDKQKAVKFMREAYETQKYRLDLALGLGVALLCYGYDEDDQKAIDEGVAILKDAAANPDQFQHRSTTEIDLSHIPIILERQEEACGYSRDGWQDLDVEKAKK